jgi:Reverse transcriptase (RNA-dependent DNA polymerase)
VTKGGITSPTIFNIATDAVVRYCLSLVLDDGSEYGGLGRTVREQLVLFCADDGLIASRNHEWLQMALARLCELFERVGLRTNVQKTKTMTCTPGYIRRPVTETAYRRRMDGVGETYSERERRRVECSIFGTGLAASSLASYYRTLHGMEPPRDVGRADAPGRQPATYSVSFPRYVNRVLCPVEGCRGSATNWANLRRHFMHRHFRDVIVILEEGPLPRCERCGMHVRLDASAARHFDSDLLTALPLVLSQRSAVKKDYPARPGDGTVGNG